MAAENPVESLQEEATCPVCLEYFTEPVTLECGHNFCRVCISQCWEGFDSAASCPQCRETVQQRNLRPNRQLANVVEITKRLSLQAARGDGVCGEHQEALKLFCEEDQTSICVICRESQAHRAHKIVPIQEAAQEYKEKIQAHLQTLREEREKLLGFKVTGEKRSQEYLKQTETVRQKIVSEFQELRQVLEEQERLLLAGLDKLDKEILKKQNENVTKLSEQISRLSELISELEGKCQKPVSEFLQVRLTLGPAVRDLRVTQRLSLPRNLLMRLEKHLQEAYEEFSPEDVASIPGYIDQRGDTRQRLPNNPERFDTVLCVLGCEGFTSGRHCWEVEVAGGGGWAVGVARESVGRKGGISRRPEWGIWAVEQWGGQFRALTSTATPLPLSRFPSRIRVCLDCDRGQVTFIDAGDEAPIFTFPPGSVPGERIQPGGKYSTGDPEISLRMNKGMSTL
uniref:Tripartite motif containing 39 n=1 Tax=Terrapene triunguis TaxID=2587831 RepID=A0A674K0U0_9SAUR